MSKEIGFCMDMLREAMIDDPAYAHSWHWNIAMAFYDECTTDISHEDAHRIANDAASRFMKLCFDVETSKNM